MGNPLSSSLRDSGAFQPFSSVTGQKVERSPPEQPLLYCLTPIRSEPIGRHKDRFLRFTYIALVKPALFIQFGKIGWRAPESCLESSC